MDPNTTIADQNTERLIQTAYQPEPAPAEFAAKLEATLKDAMRTLPARQTMPPPKPQKRRLAIVIGGVAACALLVIAIVSLQRTPPQVVTPKEKLVDDIPQVQIATWTDAMTPRKRPDAPALATLKDGETLTTKAGQRRLVQLGDGTRLYVNEKSAVQATGPRQLMLQSGQIYLEVAPQESGPRFVVKAANREFTATGTHFAVQADASMPGLIVTQGKVAVADALTPDPSPKGRGEIVVTAGQRIVPGSTQIVNAPRASYMLEWTRELMAAAETPMVPGCEHAGGALLALDPNGQEIKLALRKYHIDVHIEDGFARTTIDQTYFNTTWDRLEGTFYFPLPPDASLSRLAMYVVDANNQCKLMEGGMAERQHAANVYETIRYQRRDPALLEWLDGSTFKMRVFPLEAKQEKRIILSYTQKLAEQSGIARYRFAGGHNMPIVRDWSFHARIKNGAAMNLWSPSHGIITQPDGGDMLVNLHANNIKPTEDVVLELQERDFAVDRDQPRLSSFLHENHTYLMLRYRPTMRHLQERQRRDWIILFEASAQRDPLLAGTQVEILRQVLRNAEHDDTFTLLTANSRVQIFNDKPLPVRPKHIDEAVKFLQGTHLVGALDLQQGLNAALKIARDAKNPHLLHLGSGTPALGERDAGKLAKSLPEAVRFVGVGVGKRWNRAFMKTAAERTNGLFMQINPDEVFAWRAFDLLATLNTPRLLDLQILVGNEKMRFLAETTMIAQGEEICAITRVEGGQALPGKVIVQAISSPLPTGGEGPGVRGFAKEFAVQNVQPGAGYLPRMWAKLEIDRLLADGAAKNKDATIALSKSMYVMSPFTSLLVLETDADFERFKVDRGRKDHWAMYACPAKIPLVYEPEGPAPVKAEAKKPGGADGKPTADEVCRTIMNQPYDTEGMAAVFRDVLVKVQETRTGSLMLGAGINSDNGVVGSLALGMRNSIDLFPPALALIVRSPARIHTSFEGGIVGGKARRVDGERWLEDERIQRRQRLFAKDEEVAKDRVARRTVGLWPGQLLQYPELKIAEQNLARLNIFEALDDGKKRKLNDWADALGEKQSKRLWANAEHVAATPADYENARFDAKWIVDALPHRLGEPLDMDAPVEFSRNGRSARLASQQASFRYERPAFDYDRTLFTNLLQYAPGLHNTQADILATLEREADLTPPSLGRIDADAHTLIDKARSAEWCTLTMPAVGPLPSYPIHYNGLGQFSYERLLTSGLSEQVICDGQTLWHLYAEIGLAAKRPLSRHHHDLCSAIAPAFLPPPEELARGHNVKAIDASTIALIPLDAVKHKDAKHTRIHLVFAKDGRLSERQMVAMPNGEIVLRQLYHADGSVEWRDAKDRSLAKQTRNVAPAKAPSLQPKTADLVVMNMPIRTPAHLAAQARKSGKAERKPEDVDQWFISEVLTRALGDKLSAYDGRALRTKGVRRLGFLTLVNAANIRIDPPSQHDWPFDLEKDYPNNALAAFLAQGQRTIADSDTDSFLVLSGAKAGFIGRLNQFRNLWLTWHRQLPQQNTAALPLEKARVLEFLQETTSPTFAYAILDTMQRRGNTAPTDRMMAVAVKRFAPISDPLGLGYVLRYEHARSLWQAGSGLEAGNEFRKLYADTLATGVLPPIDADFRQVLQMPLGAGVKFIGFTRKMLDEVLRKKQYVLAFQLTKQMEQLGDEALSDEILTAILGKADAKERNALTLVSIQFQTQRQNFVQADRLLQKVLEDKDLAKRPELWHWRSDMTKRYGQTAASMACLETALDLEYADLPELVDLERLRGEYRTLLKHYQTLAEALASLKSEAPKSLQAKVIRSADRWRLLDGESTEPCMLAGKIFHTLGQHELAWDYWTTPIDLHPAESKPWLDLADMLAGQGDLQKADRALALAFEAEPTNPDLLWKRAQNLVRQGQADRARALYRQIADGQWQERFSATVEQARGLGSSEPRTQ